MQANAIRMQRSDMQGSISKWSNAPHQQPQRGCMLHPRLRASLAVKALPRGETSSSPSTDRRHVLITGACQCSLCLMSTFVPYAAATPDGGWYDSVFAFNMQNGMGKYEANIKPYKQELFAQLLAATGLSTSRSPVDPSPTSPANQSTQPEALQILEVGYGTGPNLPYYDQYGPFNLQVVGLEPKEAMFDYARHNAMAQGFEVVMSSSSVRHGSFDAGQLVHEGGRATGPSHPSGRRLQLVQGTAEAMPFADGQFDAVVCTLVMCSVADPAKALSEMHRVMKPGAQLLFMEHVISPEPGLLRTLQKLLDPLQQWLADGCHLTRDTGHLIQSSGLFEPVEAETATVEYLMHAENAVAGRTTHPGQRTRRGPVGLMLFDVESLGILAPHAAGLVSKAL